MNIYCQHFCGSEIHPQHTKKLSKIDNFLVLRRKEGNKRKIMLKKFLSMLSEQKIVLVCEENSLRRWLWWRWWCRIWKMWKTWWAVPLTPRIFYIYKIFSFFTSLYACLWVKNQFHHAMKFFHECPNFPFRIFTKISFPPSQKWGKITQKKFPLMLYTLKRALCTPWCEQQQ